MRMLATYKAASMSPYIPILVCLLLTSWVICGDTCEDSRFEALVKSLHGGLFTSLEDLKLLNESSRLLTTNHCCCRSTTEVYIFSKLKTPGPEGTEVEIVQFNQSKQYFVGETCETIPDCDLGCKCELQLRYQTALVYAPTDSKAIKLQMVEAPLQCRCINNKPDSEDKNEEFSQDQDPSQDRQEL